MPEEKDLSFPYMQQQEGHCDITLVGGDSVTKPVYCLNCKMKQPLHEDVPMNLSQALEHLLVHVDSPPDHKYNHAGYKALVRNEERYRQWKVAGYQKIKEASQAARLKKVLA
jgi:hypothetical protein